MTIGDGRGGARPGAGRPKGGPTKCDKIMALVEKNGLDHKIPPEIAKLDAVQILMYCAQYALAQGDYRTAIVGASAAAPFMHAKLNAVVTMNANAQIADLPSSDLKEMLAGYVDHGRDQPALEAAD